MTTVWQRLIVYVTESEQWRGKPVYMALVEAAREHGINGATVIRGIEGFGIGEGKKIHTARMLELSSELPILIIIVDAENTIEKFLPIVKEIVKKGLVTLENINIVHHS